MKTIYRVTETESEDDGFWEELSRYRFFPTKAQALSYAKKLKIDMQNAIASYELRKEDDEIWNRPHPLSEFLTGEYTIQVSKMSFKSNINKEMLCWVAGGALLGDLNCKEKIWEHTFRKGVSNA